MEDRRAVVVDDAEVLVADSDDEIFLFGGQTLVR
jgi:hypothetical protein